MRGKLLVCLCLPNGQAVSCAPGLSLRTKPAEEQWKVATSGALLAAGAASYFYPAFAFPLWAGWFQGRRRWAFVVAFALVVILCLATVFVRQSDPATAARDLWLNTVVHQEGEEGYGTSAFGLWGKWPALGFLKWPVLVGYLLFCLALFLWPRVGQDGILPYIALTGTVTVGTQLWKTHGGGGYHLWWAPFLVMLAVLRVNENRTEGRTK